MRTLTYGAAVAAALVLAACSNDSPTEAEEAGDDDYSLVMFGAAGSALENTMGPQGHRPFDGRTGFPHLPAELALTDAQRAEMQALRDAFKTAHQSELDALRAIFEDARTARDDGATREEVRAILQQGRTIAQGLHDDVEALHDALKGVLTDEQLAWLEANRPRPPRDVDGRRRDRRGGR